MSNLIRSTKSGSSWTSNDLYSYNIRVVNQTDNEFFGASLDSVGLEIVSEGIINGTYPSADQEEYVQEFLTYLDLAMRIKESEESAVDDFAVFLLNMLGYKGDGRIIRTRKNIPLLMCGENTCAKTDVCVMSRDMLLMLLQEDKSHISGSDPEPQVIAEAIAAFQHNNSVLSRDLGLREIEEYTFPCITMIGTSPVFYKIRVSSSLDNAVRFGTFPEEVTTVFRFDPLLGARRKSQGMTDIPSRKRILKCFRLFREVMISKYLEVM